MKTVSELTEELKAIISNYDMEVPADAILEMEIKSAIGAINRCRRFKPDGTTLYDDAYEDKIIPLAITAIMKQGAEGEIQHTENGVQRGYASGGKYPDDMLKDIVPLAKFY